MGGANGERVDKIAADFNASQSDYVVVPSYKGNYSETMTAAVAAFRANEQPDIVQVFEVGTATMMAAKGAVWVGAREIRPSTGFACIALPPFPSAPRKRGEGPPGHTFVPSTDFGTGLTC